MYVTATSPYLFMVALLIRNSILEGAIDGVLFYLKPDLAKLGDIEVSNIMFQNLTFLLIFRPNKIVVHYCLIFNFRANFAHKKVL